MHRSGQAPEKVQARGHFPIALGAKTWKSGRRLRKTTGTRERRAVRGGRIPTWGNGQLTCDRSSPDQQYKGALSRIKECWTGPRERPAQSAICGQCPLMENLPKCAKGPHTHSRGRWVKSATCELLASDSHHEAPKLALFGRAMRWERQHKGALSGIAGNWTGPRECPAQALHAPRSTSPSGGNLSKRERRQYTHSRGRRPGTHWSTIEGDRRQPDAPRFTNPPAQTPRRFSCARLVPPKRSTGRASSRFWHRPTKKTSP